MKSIFSLLVFLGVTFSPSALMADTIINIYVGKDDKISQVVHKVPVRSEVLDEFPEPQEDLDKRALEREIERYDAEEPEDEYGFQE